MSHLEAATLLFIEFNYRTFIMAVRSSDLQRQALIFHSSYLSLHVMAARFINSWSYSLQQNADCSFYSDVSGDAALLFVRNS